MSAHQIECYDCGMTTSSKPRRYHTALLPDLKLIVTELSGDLDLSEIQTWEDSLKQVLNEISDSDVFKILVNLYGFTALDLEAHKYFRAIIPLTLAQYGWKVGYVDLFEEASSMSFTTTRGIRCIGAAHVHHDEGKIEKYETKYSRSDEHYFTDPHAALKWVSELKPTQKVI